jgi:hypothetical protein
MKTLNKAGSHEETFEIVISRYNEKIDWLTAKCFTSFEKKVTVYNKGPAPIQTSKILGDNDSLQVVPLPNVGRESHSYLHHIVENYENLSDITFFLPGSCMNELKEHTTTSLISKVLSTRDTVIPGKQYHNVQRSLRAFQCNRYLGTSHENQRLNMSTIIQPSHIARPFGAWFQHFFGDLVIHVVCFTVSMISFCLM